MPDGNTLRERIQAKRPGEAVTVTVFRRDELRAVKVTLGERPHDKWSVVPVENPTDAQKAAFQAWTGQPLPHKT